MIIPFPFSWTAFTTLLILAVFSLSGCADFRGMPSLSVDLPSTFTHASYAEAPQKLSQDWWKKANDPILKSIIEEIEEKNLSLEQARFRLLAARESARTIDYFPIINLNADASYSRLIKGDVAVNSTGLTGVGTGQKKTTGYYNARLDSSWEIPLWRQYSSAKDIDKAAVEYAQSDLAAIRANVIAEAVRIYGEMRGFQQQRLLQEKMLIAYEVIANYQSIKFKAGLIPESDYISAKRSVVDAKTNLNASQNSELATRLQLAALLGRAVPDEAWEAPADIPSIRLPTLADSPLDVLRNRPDIRRAEAMVLSEAGEFELAKAEMYPRLSLSGNLSQLDNLTGMSLPRRTIQVTGTPTISLPLFDWGKRLAAAKVQNAKLSEAASLYRETVINAMTEVEGLSSAHDTAQKNLQHALDGAELEHKNHRQAQRLFRQGVNDGIIVENAHLLALSAEINVVQVKVENLSRIATLTKALGGGIPPSFEQEKKHGS